MRGLAYLTSPPQIADPEYVLTTGRLAIVTDFVHAEQADPVFGATLHKRIVEMFRENKVPARVVPYEDVVELRRVSPDFDTWSVQKIGRKLGADQVLYLRIEELHLRPPGEPVLVPKVELRLKVIGVQDPAVHARLWPDKDAEPDGRTVVHQRAPLEVDSYEKLDAEAGKLAREAGCYVARHFHKYDLEAPPPREP